MLTANMKMNTRIKTSLLILAVAVLASCSKGKGGTSYDGVPLIILDTDLVSSTDDLFAMEMLYRYEEEGKCKFLGIVVDREGEAGAAVADVMNTYFNHADTPIGLVRKGIPSPRLWIDYSSLPSLADERGEKLFRRSVKDCLALPDGWELYRRLLASAPDNSVTICSIGFVTSLAQLLESGPDGYSPLSGVDLVRRKVRRIQLMGGVFGDSVEPDFNFSQGLPFAQTFFRLWPQDVDIVFTPMEVGDPVEYTPEQVLADISWTDVHPIKQVYLTCDCDTGQKMWDPLAVINAVEGDPLFTLSPRGTVTLSDKAVTTFTASPDGNCRYQIAGDAAWAERMLGKIRAYNRLPR